MKRIVSSALALLLTVTTLSTPALAATTGSDIATVQAVATSSTSNTAVVKGGWLRLRADASYTSETLASYYTGTQVTIIGTSGNWYYVLTPDGQYGFMVSDYLTVTGSSVSTGETTAYVYASNGKPVRMRSGPSTDYSVLGSYNVGTQLTILISGSDWSKVRIGSTTGYMMTKFISYTQSTTPSTPSTSYTAYVTASNGKPVRMRSGAGSSYSIICTYSVGVQVTVLEYGKTWCKIRVNGRTGYMMTQFLTTTAPTTVTAATLNATSVWPGETLRVTVTPSSASVSYEWLNDAGTRLGTGSTYTVKTSDAGRRIRVRVTGKSGTTGSVTSGWASVQGNGYVSVAYQLTGLTLNTTTPTIGQTLTATPSPAAATANIYWYLDNGTYLGYGSTYTVQSNAVGRRIFAYAEGTGSTTGTATSSYTSTITSGTTSTITLTGASIVGTNPTVGQTLTAALYPSNATANILWYRDDNTFLGSGATYTVSSADANHRIYIWAQGTGSTTGSVTSTYTQQVSAGTSYRIDSVTLSSLNPIVGQTLTASVSPNGATAILTWYRDDDKILTYGTYYTVQADDLGHTLYVWADGTGSTTGSATSRITSTVTSY